MTADSDTLVTNMKTMQKAGAFDSIRQGLLQAIEHAENSVLGVSKQSSSNKADVPTPTGCKLFAQTSANSPEGSFFS